MKFDILNRFSGAVQFTAEIDCNDGASTAVKIGLAVKWGVRNGADLASANLAGADLASANLARANGINGWIKCIQIDTYAITYTADIMQIGCQRHPIADWAAFSYAQIRAMDGTKALAWWSKYKAWIFATIELCPAKPTRDETK